MNNFRINLCFGILMAMSACHLSGAALQTLSPVGQVYYNGAVSSARPVLSSNSIAASAPIVASSPQFVSLQGANNYQGSASAGLAGQGLGLGSSQAFAAGGSSAQAQGGAFQVGGQQQTIVTKDFYIHSAPEEPEEVISTRQAASGPAHKNYRVVFIKTPSPKFTVSTAALSGALNEEKTFIYVLAKRPDLNVIQQQVAQHAQKATKPEVFFIKYKTPEEAQLAQQEIQAQYEALGGETNVSDEGVAPVHSVIGRAGGASSGSSAGVGSGFGSAAASLSSGSASGFGFGSGSDSLSSGLGAVGSGSGSVSGGAFRTFPVGSFNVIQN